MTIIGKAISLVDKYHGNQKDKGGEAYSEHLHRVSTKVELYNNRSCSVDELNILIAISYLHDILKDTDCPDNIILEQFGPRVYDAVCTLTRAEDELYSDYIERVCANPDAIQVKYWDLIDNMNVARLKEPLTKKDLKRIQKYHNAYLKLKKLI